MPVSKTKGKGGRPKWIPGPKEISAAFKYASLGLTEEQIAHNLGVSYETLNERKKEIPEFADAIKKGKASGVQEVANKLYENAMAGNLGAQIFYLKARAGWKETSVNELTGQDGSPIHVKSEIDLTNEAIQEHINNILKK